MRESNIWVLITDGETARISSTKEGATTPVSAIAACGTFVGPEDAVFRAWHRNNRFSAFDRSAKRNFAGYLAQLLLEAGREGAYDGLIIVAAPEISKELHRALAPETCTRLIGGVVRDVPKSNSFETEASWASQH